MNHTELLIPQARTQLVPYLQGCVRDLEKHGFCILDHGWFLELGIDVSNSYQLELFRQVCRDVSNEKDQELIINGEAIPPHMMICLAPKGAEGSLPDAYAEDADGKGVLEKVREPVDPKYDGEIEINTGYR